MQIDAAYQVLAIFTPIIIGIVLGGYVTNKLIELRNGLLDLLVKILGPVLGGLFGWIFDLAFVFPFIISSLWKKNPEEFTITSKILYSGSNTW